VGRIVIAAAIGRLQANFEAFAHLQLAADATDERVPLRIGSEVGEDVPHALRASVDLDLGVEFFHGR
jgi:hypothetical protein